MAKQTKQSKRDPVAKYAEFTNRRPDMTPEQKKEAIQHYRSKVGAAGTQAKA